jgi:LemA protein
MKKFGIVIAIVTILVIWGVSKYNGLVKIDEDVKKGWSFVQTQYQRRADLYKSQVDVVKGAAKNEKDILIGVTRARAGIDDAKKGIDNAKTPAELDKYMAQAEQAALNLNIQIEAYPTITSTAAFIKFQDEISGTENRISTARDDYNVVVTKYNKQVRTIPTNLFASLFGFDVKEQFEAKEGSEDVPDDTSKLSE